uniref:Putative ovule protein n=1 Tax=Solanum chacoense TaxID=4108 RepID=A0A0V0HLS1_SOLCH
MNHFLIKMRSLYLEYEENILLHKQPFFSKIGKKTKIFILQWKKGIKQNQKKQFSVSTNKVQTPTPHSPTHCSNNYHFLSKD